MSKMIQCDNCKKLMNVDSRGEKGEYVIVKVEDPVYVFSVSDLCRECFNRLFPWLVEQEDEK